MGLVTPDNIKFKVKIELINSINTYAESLGIYDPRFPEEAQGGGYHAFKKLVLMKENLPEYSTLSYGGRSLIKTEDVPGMELIASLHVSIRFRSLQSARIIRETHKIHKK